MAVEYYEPCGSEVTYLEVASAVKEQYPGMEMVSRLSSTGALEINGHLAFFKLENGFPNEKDLSTCNAGKTPGSLCPYNECIIPFPISAL